MKPDSKFTVTPETAIRFTKISVLLTYIFAPPNADKLKFILFKIFMWTSVFFSVTLIMSLVLLIIENLDNLLIVIKSLALACTITNFIAKVMIVRIYCKEFEKLQLTVTNFVKNAYQADRTILQKYVNKCWKFQLLVTCGTYMATTTVALGPLILPQKFPTEAAYPFPVDNPIVTVIIYIQQCIVGYHCSAGVVLDCQMAVYLWYLCVKFEILILEMSYVKNYQQLRQFIRNHQSLLLYAEEVTLPIRAVAFSTITINKFILICAGVFLLTDEPVIEKIQFGIIVFSIALNIYTFIWPADCLIDVTSDRISNKLFGMFCSWTLKMKKSCVLIIQRTQSPVVINIPGFLETLSNLYYSSFLSAAFSCLTAIRAIVNS